MKGPAQLSRRRVLAGTAGVAFGGAACASVKAAPWRPLWNGRDLEGWTTWVGIPAPSVTGLDLPKKPDGTYAQPLGENNDPKGTYKVVTLQGQRVLRVSGELFGALTTRASYSNYHLWVKWRWGQAQWAPRATGPRDSGLLFHATGEQGGSGPSHNWMRSIECQIQQGDCGDLWSVGGVQLQVPALLSAQGDTQKITYDPKGALVPLPLSNPQREPRGHRSVDAERPFGQWNVTEILTRENNAEFRVNGQTVMKVHNATLVTDGKAAPLAAGRIQLQSEGAEIFFSEVKLRPL